MNRVLDKRLKELVMLLTHMRRLHERMLGTVQGKLESIRRADTEAIHKAGRGEGELARQIKDQEGLRRLLMDKVGAELGVPAAQARKMTVNELASHVSEPARAQLTVLGAEIRKLAMEIARINRINALVSHEMLRHFRNVYETMTQGTAPRNVYGRTGRPQRGDAMALLDTTG
jgi:hypothetical protein